MADVVDFESAKQARSRHIGGPCRCMNCGHEWVAVAPAGSPAGLECTECGLSKGVLREFIGADVGQERYVCNQCESDVYMIEPHGAVCVGCGWLHTWDDLAP